MKTKYLDFEVVKERWGKYNLDDHSVLKIKFSLTNVTTFEKNGKRNYKTSIQNMQTIYPADRLMGEPDKTIFTNELLQKNIEKDDLSFDPLEIPINEYILDDGTKLKLFPQVIKVARSSLKNNLGEPIYMITTNVTINFNAPKVS